MEKLTLQECEEILRNKTYYHVVYKDESGKEIRQVREDVTVAFFLYNRENIKYKKGGRLEEVRPNGEKIVLRGYRTTTPIQSLI